MPYSELLNGEKLFQQRARVSLPILIRHAKAGRPITYSSLAQLIKIPNPRNFNKILGAIGDCLVELGTSTNLEIPPITCLVLNQTTGLPSEGIGYAIDTKKFRKLLKHEQKEFLKNVLLDIYSFEHWDWVLRELKLQPVVTDLTEELEEAKGMRGGGESPSHRSFKIFIAQNPLAAGLSGTLQKGKMEYLLPSADSIDVLFTDKQTLIGVEVKSKVSNKADILRGLFQCVKYKVLLEAEQIVKDKKRECRTILALEGPFPPDLLIVKNLLDIEVVDNIQR